MTTLLAGTSTSTSADVPSTITETTTDILSTIDIEQSTSVPPTTLESE